MACEKDDGRGAGRGWTALLCGAAAGVAVLGGVQATLGQGAAALDLDAPLPMDERIVTGSLENGLEYVIKPHENPPGQVGVWIHISTGSLNEDADARGLAHYLEHMAFNGSENFPPGELIKYFESIGLTFGRDQNAFTSFDQTTYQLYLPDVERSTIARGMLFFADVADRLHLSPEEIEKERGVVLEENRVGKGPQQRVQDQWIGRLAPGSLIGERLPIGTEETISSVDREDFVEYYERYYVPGNMTVLVAGDVDPVIVSQEIEKAFGPLAAERVPADADPGVTPNESQRAIVAHDEELQAAQVAALIVDKPEGPSRTVGDLRRELIEQLATTMMNLRIQSKVAAGEVRFLGGGGFTGDLFEAVRLSQVGVIGRPAQWRDMLEDLLREMRRAELHGFGELELEEARTTIVAGLEQYAQQEPLVPSRAVLGQLNGAVAAGDALMSPSQQLSLTRRLLPTIELPEVTERFNELFDLERAAFLVTLPTAAGVPSEEEVLSLAKEYSLVTPEAEFEESAEVALLPRMPAPGEAVELSPHPGTGVVSAWLSNGVRVHHKAMPERPEQVVVRITLAGGAIGETVRNRGITEASLNAWNRPATSDLTSTQVRRLMAGVQANVGAFSTVDTVGLVISGRPKDLEPAMQLAHRLLTDPRIESVGFEQWREIRRQGIEQAMLDPAARGQMELQRALFPVTAAGARPVTVEQLESLTISQAQSWLDLLVRTAPIEVAITGGIDSEEAMRLAELYLGSLQKRERISVETLARLRVPERDEEDIEVSLTIPTQTERAWAAAGFLGPDPRDVDERRRMGLATQLLNSRLLERIREEDRLVYSIGAALIPSEAYPDFSVVLSGSSTDPQRGAELAGRVYEVFEAFAEGGPSEEEMSKVRAQVAKSMAEAMEEPGFWASQLGDAAYRDRSLDDLVDPIADLQAISGEEIRSSFKRYFESRPKISVTVRPEPTGG